MAELSPGARHVTPTGGRRVLVLFTDGTEAVIDLSPLLRGPVFEKIASDPEEFARVRISEVGKALEWPDGADVDPEVIYRLATGGSAVVAG